MGFFLNSFRKIQENCYKKNNWWKKKTGQTMQN